MQDATLDWTHAWPSNIFQHAASCAADSGAPLLKIGEDGGCHSHGSACRERMQGFVNRLESEVSSLPFLSLPFAENLTQRLDELTPYLRGFRHMLVLGIGGSALGARALQKSFFPAQDRPGHNGPWLWIADNIEPASFKSFLNQLPAEETLVVVISKSGGTVETMAQYLLVLPWLQQKLSATWKDHLFMVTDEKQGILRAEAEAHGIRSLPVPDGLGGRYSVLSAVGLVPAVFMGIDWKALLQGAMDFGRPLAANPGSLLEHPSWKTAVWASHLTHAHINQLIFFCYIPSMAYFGAWFSQLWAESLGKSGKGSMPLPAVGVTDQHSLLQMFLDGPSDKGCLFLTSPAEGGLDMPRNLPDPWKWLEGHTLGDILEAETLATQMSLSNHGVPMVAVHLPKADEYYAGKLMMYLEATTVFTGWLLDINPLDQPAVEEGKILAKAKLGAVAKDEDIQRLKFFMDEEKKRMKF